jgi:anti-anti-sigma factor
MLRTLVAPLSQRLMPGDCNDSRRVPVRVRPRRTLLPFAGRAAAPTVLRLQGEYDLSTVAWLWEALARAMTQHDADLVIDLSDAEFTDAATVGVIVGARNHLRRRSRSLALRCPSRRARCILDLCGLAGLVESGPRETPRTPTTGALGAWVTRSATDRVDRQAIASASDLTVDSVGGGSAEAKLSAPDADLLAARRGTPPTWPAAEGREP